MRDNHAHWNGRILEKNGGSSNVSLIQYSGYSAIKLQVVFCHFAARELSRQLKPLIYLHPVNMWSANGTSCSKSATEAKNSGCKSCVSIQVSLKARLKSNTFTSQNKKKPKHQPTIHSNSNPFPAPVTLTVASVILKTNSTQHLASGKVLMV